MFACRSRCDELAANLAAPKNSPPTGSANVVAVVTANKHPTSATADSLVTLNEKVEMKLKRKENKNVSW